jgi:hypothetical protein
MHFIARSLSLPVACVALLGAAGQRQPLPPAGQAAGSATAADPVDEGVLDQLLLLGGNRVEVRFVADTLDRAARFQARLETLHRFWQPLLEGRLAWRGAAVLEPQWRRLVTGRPWGVAARSASGTFLVPAAGDARTVATIERLLGGPVPLPAGMPLYGSLQEAGSLVVCDILLQIEAARAFVAASGVRGEEPWIEGLVIHLAARAAWQAAEPERILEIVGLLDRMSAANGGPAAYRLSDYREDLPFERALWYDAQFVRGADAIWVEEGRRGTTRLLRRWVRSRDEPILRAKLEENYPVLVAWQRAAFAP